MEDLKKVIENKPNKELFGLLTDIEKEHERLKKELNIILNFLEGLEKNYIIINEELNKRLKINA
jgi:hypothetical protein